MDVIQKDDNDKIMEENRKMGIVYFYNFTVGKICEEVQKKN